MSPLGLVLLTTLLPMNNSYGLWGFLTSVYGFFTGVLMDNLGVKWSLIVGTSLCVAGRFLLAVSSAPWSIYLSLYFLQPLGMSLGIPVLTIAIKRYTNEDNRTFAFSTFYAVMNVAALIAGPATDILRYLFKDGVWLFGIKMSAIRLIFLSGSAASGMFPPLSHLLLSSSKSCIAQQGQAMSLYLPSLSLCIHHSRYAHYCSEKLS
jgi:MFS family permease